MTQANKKTEAIVDSLVEDILQSSEAELLAEVKEDYGHPRALAEEFDRLAGPLTRTSENSYVRTQISPVKRENTNSRTHDSGPSISAQSLVDFFTRQLGVLLGPGPMNLRLATASLAVLAVVVTSFLVVKNISSDHPISVSGVSRSKPQVSSSASDSVNSNLGTGSYIAVVSQGSEEEVKANYRVLQERLPGLLANRGPIIKNETTQTSVYFAGVGPFATIEEASAFCDKLKDANVSCRPQKN